MARSRPSLEVAIFGDREHGRLYRGDEAARDAYFRVHAVSISSASQAINWEALTRWLSGDTYALIGASLGVSPQRAQQRVARALRLLRHPRRIRLYAPIQRVES